MHVINCRLQNMLIIRFVFPAIVSFAFLSEKPVEVFCESFSRALKSTKLNEKLEYIGEKSKMQIHAAWYESYYDIFEIVSETVNDMNLPPPKLGIEVIDEKLTSHPIFKEFPEKIRGMRGNIIWGLKTAQHEPYDQHILQTAVNDMHTVFTFFGEPTYRLFLGKVLHPPKIVFNNFNIFADRPIKIRHPELYNMNADVDNYGDNYKKHHLELEARIKNFRNAQAKNASKMSNDHLKQ